MKTANIWKIEYQRIVDHNTATLRWESKMVTAENIIEAVEIFMQFSKQEEWRGVIVHSAKFSHKFVMEEDD